jgi:hypothetical protein
VKVVAVTIIGIACEGFKGGCRCFDCSEPARPDDLYAATLGCPAMQGVRYSLSSGISK